MGRERTLSDKGKELLNYENDDNPRRFSSGCLKNLLHKFLTSDFDIEVENSTHQMRKATKKLYSYLLEIDEEKKLSKFINNAVTNILVLIFTDGNKIYKRQKVKMNINYYLTIAKHAFKNQDHQTALLIKCALDSHTIRRLKIKYKKRQLNFIKELEDTYGNYKSCHYKHLSDILKGYRKHFLPSAMIMEMHHNKSREITKTMARMGKKPSAMVIRKWELEKVIQSYKDNYKNTNDELLGLYSQDPLKHNIMWKYQKECKSIQGCLYEIAREIK